MPTGYLIVGPTRKIVRGTLGSITDPFRRPPLRGAGRVMYAVELTRPRSLGRQQRWLTKQGDYYVDSLKCRSGHVLTGGGTASSVFRRWNFPPSSRLITCPRKSTMRMRDCVWHDGTCDTSREMELRDKATAAGLCVLAAFAVCMVWRWGIGGRRVAPMYRGSRGFGWQEYLLWEFSHFRPVLRH